MRAKGSQTGERSAALTRGDAPRSIRELPRQRATDSRAIRDAKASPGTAAVAAAQASRTGAASGGTTRPTRRTP